MWKKRPLRTFYVFCFHFNVPLIFNKIMLKTMTHMSNYLIIDQGFHNLQYLKIQCLSFLIVTLILCSVLRRFWLSCLEPSVFIRVVRNKYYIYVIITINGSVFLDWHCLLDNDVVFPDSLLPVVSDSWLTLFIR